VLIDLVKESLKVFKVHFVVCSTKTYISKPVVIWENESCWMQPCITLFELFYLFIWNYELFFLLMLLLLLQLLCV